MLHISGGRIISRRTRSRVGLNRDAALRDALDTIPVDLRRWVEWERPETGPPYHDYADWWRPRIYSSQLFWRDVPGMGGEIAHLPAQVDTDEFLRQYADAKWPSDSGDGEWGQPLNVMDMDWQFENGPDDVTD